MLCVLLYAKRILPHLRSQCQFTIANQGPVTICFLILRMTSSQSRVEQGYIRKYCNRLLQINDFRRLYAIRSWGIMVYGGLPTASVHNENAAAIGFGLDAKTAT
ncbi:hypothetical protein BDQ94DRAFT_132344 [Aspergillus welwitschiae]|uniref:Uncharacterized protein n=1 Tax=Aspergillus welwitschiae TaxID=1341132 RepID=A0A3F3QIK0_9EURO|nr:hypothetical protein BDQ94DRAFT_132344 [Aspergillus welwitschiae]RDH39093.1 hypothetical protein BDQ94DRAFT_132344 [Aspergillus welwitschiae]